MLNLGNASAKDFALGQNLVERIDFGSNVVFDPYSNVTGNLPLVFNSRVTAALKTYRLYGTSEGAGVETDNLFEIYSNGGGYVEFETGGLNVTIDRYDQSILVNNTSTTRYPQAFIKGSQGVLQLNPNKTYTAAVATDNSPENAKIYLMIQATLDNSNWITIASTINNPSVAFSFTENYVNYRYLFVCEGNELTYNNTKVRISIVEGEVSSFIPFGYKIPLTNTSGETENLWDSDITNITLHIINAQGDLRQAFVIDAPGTYAIKCYVRYGYVYGKTYSEISGEYSNTIYLSVPESSSIPTAVMTATIQDNEKIIIFDASSSSQTNPAATVEKFDASELCVVLGSTAPDHYIPHRYTADYNLYIGDTKLGEEEYVDYQEQKVYKRTENLWNPNTSFTEGKFINPTGGLGTDLGWRASDYVDIDSNKQYTFFVNTTAAPAARHAFYNSDMQFISAINTGTQTFITPNDAAYARFSCRTTTTKIMLVEGSTAPETYIPYLQPTDPPAPFPAITAYKGENTLSSTETVGNVTVKGRIEASYRYLEYITLPDDTGFITDIIPTNTTRTEMDVRFSAVNPTNENANCLWGLMRQPNSQTSSYEYYNMFIARGTFNEATRTVATFYTGQKTVYSWFNQSSSMVNRIEVFDLPTASLITVKLQKGSSTFGTYACQNDADTTLVNPTVGIGIGGRHAYRDDTQSGILQYCNMGVNKYLYAFRVYDDNDVLIHNLLPARRQSDGELGLLDVYTSRFYTNVGTGTITPPN